jgi:hypothetical protein
VNTCTHKGKHDRHGSNETLRKNLSGDPFARRGICCSPGKDREMCLPAARADSFALVENLKDALRVRKYFDLFLFLAVCSFAG